MSCFSWLCRCMFHMLSGCLISPSKFWGWYDTKSFRGSNIYYVTANTSSKLTLNHIVGMIQSEELQRRSMGLSKEDTSDVHNCGETTTVGEDQSCTTEKQGHTRSKFTDRNPNSFCTYCKTLCHPCIKQCETLELALGLRPRPGLVAGGGSTVGP